MSAANDKWAFQSEAEEEDERSEDVPWRATAGSQGEETDKIPAPPRLSSISPSSEASRSKDGSNEGRWTGGPEGYSSGVAEDEQPMGARFDLLSYYTSLKSGPRKRWIVPGILREGLTLFAGAPKAGKSFCSLDIAFSVAVGGLALGSLVCHQGSVLYLALEDHSHRIASRLELLEPDLSLWPWGDTMMVPTIDTITPADRPSVLIRRWVAEADNPLLLIVDTLGRLRDFSHTVGKGGYQEDVRALSWLQRFTQEHHLATLVVHHTNQTGKDNWKDDWATKIGGTSGLTGTADALWLLDADRGEPTGRLLVGGRDLPDRSVSLSRVGPWWQATSEVPDESGDVLETVGRNPGLVVSDLAFLLSMPVATCRRYLSRLRMAGRVEERTENRWWPSAPVDERSGR